MFNMELKTLSSINDYEVKTYNGRKYDNELDDGRSVIADICEVFDDTNEVLFKVSGFGENNWPVDSRVDLPIVIEQLPEILSKIDHSDFNFELDFYEQGIERRIDFQDKGDFVNIACISQNDWVPTPNIIEMKKEDVSIIFENLYQNFLIYSRVFCGNLAENILLKEWMAYK